MDVIDFEWNVDVVVVGGGIAGLWILNALRDAGRSVLLLESAELGTGQTAHSHVYIHEGHLYRGKSERDVVNDLIEAHQLWEDWLVRNPVDPQRETVPHEQGLFGFRSDARAADVTTLWKSNGLVCEPTDAIDLFNGSIMTSFLHANSPCLDAQWLVEALAAPHRDALVQLPPRTLVIENDWDRVTAVRFASEGRSFRVACRAIVFAAGHGNSALVQQLDPYSPLAVDHTRPSYMSVLRGPAAVLEPLSGMFEINPVEEEYASLFIVSRRLSTDETVWLVSDACRFKTLGSWLDDVIHSEIRDVFPQVYADRAKVQWGAYLAPKAEPRKEGTAMAKHVVYPVWPNVLAVWPMKLTLAPIAAHDVVDAVDKMIPAVWSEQPDFGDVGHVAAAPELWRETEMKSWDEFAGAHGLPL